jgi:L-fuconolactonase
MSDAAEAPIIDTHAHVWDVNAPWMAWLAQRPAAWDVVRRSFAWSELRDELDGAGVSDVVLVQAGTSTEETRMLLGFAARQPSVVGVVGWVTLTSAAAAEAGLDSLDVDGDGKLVGIRSLHRWEPDGAILSAPRAVDAYELLAERRLPLDLFLNDHTELSLAISIAERAPGGRYVIDHLGRPPIGDRSAFAAWADSMTALSELPNVYVKYSGWATLVGRTLAAEVRPFIDHVLERFGSERVMYGGNWPVALLGGSYRDTFLATLDAVADLPEADLANVLGRTATDCYGLAAARSGACG